MTGPDDFFLRNLSGGERFQFALAGPAFLIKVHGRDGFIFHADWTDAIALRDWLVENVQERGVKTVESDTPQKGSVDNSIS